MPVGVCVRVGERAKDHRSNQAVARLLSVSCALLRLLIFMSRYSPNHTTFSVFDLNQCMGGQKIVGLRPVSDADE